MYSELGFLKSIVNCFQGEQSGSLVMEKMRELLQAN